MKKFLFESSTICKNPRFWIDEDIISRKKIAAATLAEACEQYAEAAAAAGVEISKTQQKRHGKIYIDDKDGTLFLLSYGNTVAKLTPWGELTFGKDWDYSKTTLKHIYLFLTEYVVAYLGHYIGEGWHFLTEHFDIHKWIYGKNKRAFLQNLIDEKVIDYKADL